MNRFVSLLLVALSLAAVSLARPAQAQQGQWYRGLPYFGSNFSQNCASGTTATATIYSSSGAHLNITASPTNSYAGYSTSGNAGGDVKVYYVWSGGNPTQSGTLTTTQSLEATGTGNGSTNGYSTAGQSGQQAHGDFPHSLSWDSTASATSTFAFSAGVAPPSQMQTTPISASISASYSGSSTSSIVTADVSFGAPVVTP